MTAVIAHLVHGTWPYGPLRKRPKAAQPPCWFFEDSRFCRAVGRQSSLPVRFVPFEWSGKNGFAARRRAAEELHAHLSKWMRCEPEACHLIIAHSHGGTVSVAAVADPLRPLPGKLAGLMTLGTPFVSLRGLTDAGPGSVIRMLVMVGSLPLLLGFGLALGAGLLIGGPGVASTVFALTVGVVLLLVVSADKLGLLRRAERRIDRFHELVRWSSRVPRLPCELVAVRAPGDEARLAIGGAQLIDMVFGGIWSALVNGPLRWLQRRLNTRPALTLALGYPLSIGLSVLYDWSFDGVIQNRWLHMILGPWILGVGGAMVFTALMLAPFVVLLPAVAALAGATGLEVLWYYGAATVDAEPLPAGTAARLEMINLPNRLRRPGRLRHSLHSYFLVRRRVARWIDERTTAFTLHSTGGPPARAATPPAASHQSRDGGA